MKRVSFVALLLILAALLTPAACSSTKASPAVDAGDDDSGAPVFGGSRPATLHVPSGYDPSKPAPLVMMLHGYSSANILTELYFPMGSIADAHGFFYLAPNGTVDSGGKRFWNATDACCDFDHTGVDDVGYLMGLLRDVRAAYNIDPQRIYVMGHSNGGYMSHRLACDHAETFAAIVSYAGAVWDDPAKCNPVAPIGVLQIHGTADDTVLYDGNVPTADGGDAGPPPPGAYPGAKQTVAIWAAKNGCSPALTDTGTTSHVNADGQGSETRVSRHDGCKKNGAAELWTVKDAPHVFSYTPAALEQIWTFLEAHAKTP